MKTTDVWVVSINMGYHYMAFEPLEVYFTEQEAIDAVKFIKENNDDKIFATYKKCVLVEKNDVA